MHGLSDLVGQRLQSPSHQLIINAMARMCSYKARESVVLRTNNRDYGCYCVGRYEHIKLVHTQLLRAMQHYRYPVKGVKGCGQGFDVKIAGKEPYDYHIVIQWGISKRSAQKRRRKQKHRK